MTCGSFSNGQRIDADFLWLPGDWHLTTTDSGLIRMNEISSGTSQGQFPSTIDLLWRSKNSNSDPSFLASKLLEMVLVLSPTLSARGVQSQGA